MDSYTMIRNNNGNSNSNSKSQSSNGSDGTWKESQAPQLHTEYATFSLNKTCSDKDMQKIITSLQTKYGNEIDTRFVSNHLTISRNDNDIGTDNKNTNIDINSLPARHLNELWILDDLAQLGFSKVKIESSNIPEVQSHVNIQGMTCGACSATITEKLESESGISKASISLVTEVGLVTHSINYPTQKIIECIEECGFDAQLQPQLMQTSRMKFTNANRLLSPNESHTPQLQQPQEPQQSRQPQNQQHTVHTVQTVLGISGMTCGACSSSLNQAFEQLEGVESASVSLLTEEALVRHKESVTKEILEETVENCGFSVKYSKRSEFNSGSSSINANAKGNVNAHDEDDTSSLEEMTLSIIGVNQLIDQQDLRYNIEALMASLNGIESYDLQIRDEEMLESSFQDDAIAATASVHDLQNSFDKLSFIYNPTVLGIRDIVDGLNEINENVDFLVLNTLDQSSASQLKLLSKTKDIQYWRNIFLQSLLTGIPVLVLVHTENTDFWKKLVLFRGLYLVSLVELILATYIQFYLGSKFIQKFTMFIRRGFKGASMDVLVSISTLVSYIFSLASITLSVWLGRSEKPPKVLFDTLVMLISFVSFGKLLENKAKGATSTALSSLLQLTPSTCTIIEDTALYENNNSYNSNSKGSIKSGGADTGTGTDTGAAASGDANNDANNGEKDFSLCTGNYQTRSISIDLVQPNDIAIVLPGGKIPADGFIVFGETEVNESFLTGETLPIYKTRGDSVIGGSINGPHLIHIKVTKTGNKSQLQQIIKLVKDSQVNKAPVQRFSDAIAARFVPTIIFLAVSTFIIWSVICYNVHPDGLPMIFRKSENGKLFICLQLAISVIVVACPCALGLAAPTAVMVGTGVGASNGVLIKGADILEKSTSINILLFDKTGTLTTGEMSIEKAFPKSLDSCKLSVKDWWTMIGSVECTSEHPVGRALTKKARIEAGINFDDDDTFDTKIENVNVMIGTGIEADVTLNSVKYNVNVGNAKLLRDKFPNLLKDVDPDNALHSETTVAFVVIDGIYTGHIELSDSLKQGSVEIIDYLRNEGYIIGMVTGDNRGAALKIGKELGLSEENIFYEVSPIHKDEVITNIKERLGNQDQNQDVGIAFIGDGINDAPALARADIGMAISSGTDIAMDSSDIVLIGSRKHDQTDLHGVVNALKISSKTFSRIKWNFIWAIVYNLFMLPFAMGCFLPFNLMLPPVAASIAMMCSSLSVVFNSLLLKRWQPPRIKSKSRSSRDLELGSTVDNVFSLKNGTKEEFLTCQRKVTSGYSMGLKNILLWMKRVGGGKRGRTPQLSNASSYELVASGI